MQPHISGTTRLYGLVGDPLSAAKSPRLLNQLFVDQRVDAVCVPFWVKPDNLPAFVAGARAMGNLSGLLVTMPHKQRMLTLVDELDSNARQVGAVNVIRCEADGRWVGTITDGVGCVLGMQWKGNCPDNKSVLLVGAGGAGRAIAFAIASAGASRLIISDVDEERSDELAASVATETGCNTRPGPPDPHGFECVINATPLGMKANDPMPVDPERLAPGAIVVDIVNSAEPTPLLRAAQERGCRIQDGGSMHQGQALYALRFLGFDYRPDERTTRDESLK